MLIYSLGHHAIYNNIYSPIRHASLC